MNLRNYYVTKRRIFKVRSQAHHSRVVRSAVTLVAFFTFWQVADAQQSSTGPARVVGTIQVISGKSLTVISDTGVSSDVRIEDATKFLQIEPGRTDLKEATPLSFKIGRASCRKRVYCS